jgi:hypothetical protein
VRAAAGLLQHQPGCAHQVSDGFAVSLIAPVLLTAEYDARATAGYLCRTAVWTADRYDLEYGGAGLAGTSADPETDVAWLLGSAFENGPPRRPWSYIATVLADLSAIIPEARTCTRTQSTTSWPWMLRRAHAGRRDASTVAARRARRDAERLNRLR